MKIKYKALLYDIANMAYLIADTGEPLRHTLHRVRDICQDGNIDRVARILGLAYSRALSVLSPILVNPKINPDKDESSMPHDYVFNFKCNGGFKYLITTELKLHLKETIHEYMVCMVLADWLAVTLPEAADVWKFRVDKALEALSDSVASISYSACGSLRRTLSPF